MTTPLDLDAMRARDRAFGDGESEAAFSIAMDRHALLAHVASLAAEVERLRAALAVAESGAAPTRGTLINALASAGAARVAAQHAADTATLATVTAARMRVVEAKEAESAARAALDAFERADREADPCPGSRGY